MTYKYPGTSTETQSQNEDSLPTEARSYIEDSFSTETQPHNEDSLLLVSGGIANRFDFPVEVYPSTSDCSLPEMRGNRENNAMFLTIMIRIM